VAEVCVVDDFDGDSDGGNDVDVDDYGCVEICGLPFRQFIHYKSHINIE
jgi:hypothetical protein